MTQVNKSILFLHALYLTKTLQILKMIILEVTRSRSGSSQLMEVDPQIDLGVF